MDVIINWLTGFGNAFYINFIKQSRYLLILNGLKETILISLLAILFGVFMGCVTAALRRSKFKIPRAIGYVYVDIIRGTPMVTQLVIIYFVVFAAISVNPFWVAVIAFGLNSGAYVSEIIRAGILSIDNGQTEAGRSLGLSKSKTMAFIVLPQAIKNILPALANEFIMLIKETAVVGYIAMQDLTKAADIIRSLTYDPYMPLLTAAIIYYIIIKSLTLLIAKFERWLRKSDYR